MFRGDERENRLRSLARRLRADSELLRMSLGRLKVFLRIALSRKDIRFAVKGSAPEGLAIQDVASGIAPNLDLDVLIPEQSSERASDPDRLYNLVNQCYQSCWECRFKARYGVRVHELEQKTTDGTTRSFAVTSSRIRVDVFPKHLRDTQDGRAEVWGYSGKTADGRRLSSREHFDYKESKDLIRYRSSLPMSTLQTATLLVKYCCKIWRLGVKSSHINLLVQQEERRINQDSTSLAMRSIWELLLRVYVGRIHRLELWDGDREVFTQDIIAAKRRPRLKDLWEHRRDWVMSAMSVAIVALSSESPILPPVPGQVRRRRQYEEALSDGNTTEHTPLQRNAQIERDDIKNGVFCIFRYCDSGFLLCGMSIAILIAALYVVYMLAESKWQFSKQEEIDWSEYT
mmetsp:Transcript_6882/g.10506  ORF Transcript_6882/g.10506 Transcript_6882/m.10506 type:complete len:401 (-) Transcript_6882:116-1318(-)